MIDTDIIVGIVIGLLAGISLAATYFIIWRTPQRVSYAAAKLAFKSAGMVVAGAQKELEEGLKLSSLACKQVEEVFAGDRRRMGVEFASVRCERDSALSYTKKLRGALKDFLGDLSPEEKVGTLPRTLQMQTIESAVRELEELEKKAADLPPNWYKVTEKQSNGAESTRS